MLNKTTKFRPILFSTPMVQAILEGRKTQTRRIIKDNLLQTCTDEYNELEFLIITSICPHKVGDVLWARETFVQQGLDSNNFVYKANHPEKDLSYRPLGGWKPSIFMPKEACRIFLKIKSIRVERLFKISEGDAIAEGVELYDTNLYKDYLDERNSFSHARISFDSLWVSINGIDSWNKNPFVWVYEFEKIEKPLDFI